MSGEGHLSRDQGGRHVSICRKSTRAEGTGNARAQNREWSPSPSNHQTLFTLS